MTIQEVKQLDKDSYQIIDIRDDNEIAHGAIPGAVALKVEEIAENPLVDKSKKLVICCSRGKYSVDVAEELSEKGIDAESLEGGYIAWLIDNMKQKEAAEKSKQELANSGKFDKPIVTSIEKAMPFYPAEDYHQDFYKKDPERYALEESGGRSDFIKKHWSK